MKNKRLILVTGATGGGGGSVARALLAGDKFAVRILTRNTSSDKAIALKNAGAEVVEGDFGNVEILKSAMKECYGVFGVTSFRELFGDEYVLGKNLIDAVAQSNIKHFVFSSQDDYNKLSNGTLPVPRYDVKATLQDYAKQLKLPATFAQVSFYYENFLSLLQLLKDDDGGYSFGLPQGNTKLATVSVEDYGGIVSTVFNHPIEYIGRTVRAVGEDNTCAGYAAILSDVLGEKISFNYIPKEEYAALDFPGAKELANMFEVQRLYIPNRQFDLIESYGLNPRMQHFRSWVIKNKQKFIDYFESLSKTKAVA